ncbi:hypothetical protein RUESEDTHA_00385 [Ruegeria sp. THAF57]|uniref:hypothetical protein n=1 Tax=Ruegeria sp. THAF57 TaxID=2744555 RepID=UPI001755DAE1|nr:hypothetical protein [Ruegeria sp. THAF57]CAD0183515.1 hypothetical protein RUESEDTHA_00385 [Ruegeria sp. THAF57]
MLSAVHHVTGKTRRMKTCGRALVVCASAALVASCGLVTPSSDRVVFDGQYFRAKAKVVDKKTAPTDFTVVVNGVSASLDGAREAGRYEGTKFCIAKYGSSRIDWKVGPDTEPQNLRITDDKLTFAGKCLRP